jgi:uncharacterized protein (DUF58 family)
MSWVNVLAVLLIALMAIGSGRRVIFWSLCAIFFGFWAVLLLAFLPKKPLREIHLPALVEQRIKLQTIKKWAKGVNYVEDIA